MALATYTDLQAAVALWANRTDLTARIPDFIALAETRIWGRLRAKALTKDLSLSYTAGTTALDLPDDLISVVSLRDTSAGRAGVVDVVSYDRFQELQSNSALLLALNTQICVTGRELLFVVPPSASGTIVGRYLAREPALATVATNEILRQYPDLYLFGTLLEVCDYLHDNEGALKYSTRFDSAMEAANQQHGYMGERSYRSPRMTIV